MMSCRLCSAHCDSQRPAMSVSDFLPICSDWPKGSFGQTILHPEAWCAVHKSMHTHAMTPHCNSRADTPPQSSAPPFSVLLHLSSVVTSQQWVWDRWLPGWHQPRVHSFVPSFHRFHTYTVTLTSRLCSHTHLLWPYLAARLLSALTHKLHCQCVSEALLKGVTPVASCFRCKTSGTCFIKCNAKVVGKLTS